MSVWRDRILALHQFCVHQLLYPLILSSLLACTLYFARVYLSESRTFSFLLWNLFLAWIPYIFSLFISQFHERQPRRWVYLVLPGLFWLIFLPNAPYLVTDIVHLSDPVEFPLWYDIGMFATFAWTGCLLGVVSLNHMHRVVHRISGVMLSWFFVLGVIGLSGFGIFLGRFHNLNSWDLFLKPRTLATFVVSRLLHPLGDLHALGVTLLFAAFILVCYVTFLSIEHRRVAAPEWRVESQE